jgi:hypothetical protein
MDEENNVNVDELKNDVQEVMEKLRAQSMLLGGKAACTVIYNIIQKFNIQPGKRSMNDYKRLVKEIEKFCKTAVDHEVETPTFKGGVDASEE